MKRNLFTLNPHLINRYLLKNTTLTERFKKISKLVSNQEKNDIHEQGYNFIRFGKFNSYMFIMSKISLMGISFFANDIIDHIYNLHI